MHLPVRVICLALLLQPFLVSAHQATSSPQEKELQMRQSQWKQDWDLRMEQYDTNVRQHTEEQRTVHNAIYAAGSLGLIALGLFIWWIRQSRRQRDLDLKLDAARVILDPKYGTNCKAKAEVFAALFPKELARYGSIFGSREFFHGRIELLRLVAEHPEREKEIAQAYSMLFPADEDGDFNNRLTKTTRSMATR